MHDKEKELSEYIDCLNAEKKPKEHEAGTDSDELEELMSAVRQLKSLKEPELPSADFPHRLVQNLSEKRKPGIRTSKTKTRWFMGIASAAAVITVVFLFNLTLGFKANNLIYAMEQAFQEVKAYHGYLEIVETNAAGNSTTQAKLEVYANQQGSYFLKEIEGARAGMITVNNGKEKWQIRPDTKQVHFFAAFPDPYRFTFELGKELESVKAALETKYLGEEVVADRHAFILKVTPKGGDAYKLWIDKATKLPLKKEGAMQNAIQYSITYTTMEYLDAIPGELVAYTPIEGFTVVQNNTELLVNNLQEAIELAEFSPEIPESAGYVRQFITVEPDSKTVKLYYEKKSGQQRVVILQGKAVQELKPAAAAILGKIEDNTAEIQSPVQVDLGVLAGGRVYAGAANVSSIRWQEEGMEYAVAGDASMEDLKLFVEEISKGSLQIAMESNPSVPQHAVEINQEIEQNEQKSVDAGHSPWKIDPVFVAQVFVSLQISPEGIQGEYPIQYEELQVIQNDGATAVIALDSDKTDINKIYLKKLVRQDPTGIWSVVGYNLK